MIINNRKLLFCRYLLKGTVGGRINELHVEKIFVDRSLEIAEYGRVRRTQQSPNGSPTWFQPMINCKINLNSVDPIFSLLYRPANNTISYKFSQENWSHVHTFHLSTDRTINNAQVDFYQSINYIFQQQFYRENHVPTISNRF